MPAALVLLLGFALPPLAPLTSVPPGRVLRRELEGDTHMMWLGYAVGIACFGALLMVAAGEIKLGVIVAGGFAAAECWASACSRASRCGRLRGLRAQVMGSVAWVASVAAQRSVGVMRWPHWNAVPRERAADHGAGHRPDVFAAVGDYA